jgi:uncharacterized protein (DUF58 family)
MSSLFGEEFVATISRLRIVSRRVPRGGRHAEQSSRQLGAGMEFADFRSYMPGDDIRRIDWNLYRRSGRLFLRLFEELQDLPVYVLLDVSDSMFFETPPRANVGRQMAAAMIAAALNQQDAPGLYPFGRDLLPGLRSVSGRTGLSKALNYLDDLSPAGPTHLEGAVRRFSSMRLRRGFVVVVSDFFDPDGIDTVVGALSSLRHRLLLVQIVRAADASPELSGQLRLLDCENAGEVDVTIAPQVLERYREAYRSFQDALLRFAVGRRAGYVAVDADEPIVEQLGKIFVNGVLVTRE